RTVEAFRSLGVIASTSALCIGQRIGFDWEICRAFGTGSVELRNSDSQTLWRLFFERRGPSIFKYSSGAINNNVDTTVTVSLDQPFHVCFWLTSPTEFAFSLFNWTTSAEPPPFTGSLITPVSNNTDIVSIRFFAAAFYP